MPSPIEKYHVVTFRSLQAASDAIAQLQTHVNVAKGLRHNTGPRRAVVWGHGPESSASDQANIYLSPGALEAAGELPLVFSIGAVLEPAQLPPSCLLLLGDPIG